MQTFLHDVPNNVKEIFLVLFNTEIFSQLMKNGFITRFWKKIIRSKTSWRWVSYLKSKMVILLHDSVILCCTCNVANNPGANMSNSLIYSIIYWPVICITLQYSLSGHSFQQTHDINKSFKEFIISKLVIVLW